MRVDGGEVVVEFALPALWGGGGAVQLIKKHQVLSPDSGDAN